MIRELFSYAGIRLISWPFSFLPYSVLHIFGKWLGSLVFYVFPKFRKRAQSNLALASTLKLSSEQIPIIAKSSIQNVMITCLEYAKLAREKTISRIAFCENPEEAAALLEKTKKGIIFFCAHQANWELLFLEGTSRMAGVAIGRPTKNKLLYKWVLKIRQKFGGAIIEPRNAIRESLRALRKKCFLGIVGDQGMPQGGFASFFMGRPAYTSPLPAILAYRTGSPLLVATIRRHEGRYAIRYSSPLYADASKDMDEEIARLMTTCLDILAASIHETPSEWLWQHNRWKQLGSEAVKKPFRFDPVCVILPQDLPTLHTLLPHLSALRSIYAAEHFTVIAPEGVIPLPELPSTHWRFYQNQQELFVPDYGPKLVFNFTELPQLSKRYRKHSAFRTLSLSDLWRLANVKPHTIPLSELFHKAMTHAR